MKKIAFYVSTIVFLYLCFILINIFIYHFENLNDFGNGFLIGKILLLIFFGFLLYKTNPFGNTKGNTNQQKQ
jgi:hypothetical protein